MQFKETFRPRNAPKNSGLRVGIRIAFTDYEQGCATDCAGRRLPGWGICSGPGTSFPSVTAQHGPAPTQASSDLRGSAANRHAQAVPQTGPRESAELLSLPVLCTSDTYLTGLTRCWAGAHSRTDSQVSPAGRRGLRRAAQSREGGPLTSWPALPGRQSKPPVTGHLRPWWEIQEHAPKLAHAH